jgi:hypothetical protein
LVVGSPVAPASERGISGVALAWGFIISHWGVWGKKNQEKSLSIVKVDGTKQRRMWNLGMGEREEETEEKVWYLWSF